MAHLAPHIQDKLVHLPQKPGVYLFKDRRGEILYIGKAKILRHRVRSYFQSTRTMEAKQARLVSRIFDLETIITDSEVEALILEANLIKENRPRYNINLKDDKSFPYIRVTNESFPRIFPTRKIVRDGSQYFGPFTDVYGMRELLKTIRKIFPVRSCKLKLTPESIADGKFKVCLDYHIKRCHGPCEGLVSREEYNRVIDYIIRFIQGQTENLEREINNRIQELATNLQFEQAARLRDQLKSLEIFQEHQKIVDPSLADRDIVAVASEGNDSCCVVFRVRSGKILGRQHFYLSGAIDEEKRSILYAFLQQYYLKADYIPQQVLLSEKLQEDQQMIEEWLAQKTNAKVTLTTPQRGEKARLMKMCRRNARLLLDELIIQKEKARDFISGAVLALQKDLQLKYPPRRIEGFDISNIQGTNPVASMVSFQNGKAAKSEYRHFRIRGKATPDDFAMMREAVFRRYSRLIRERRDLPDLVLVDGGKGQLSAARSALAELNLDNQPVIALAKRLDEIYVPGSADPLNIRRDSPGLHLLQRIRDESHRFAVTYHRKRRKKATLTSDLRTIPGIGPARSRLLLKKFGSLKKIKSASLEELRQVDGIHNGLAELIWNTFNKKE